MKNKIYIFLLIAISILLTIDISIRIFYCSEIYLKFNSEEFNYIVSPIISILGFLGVIIAVCVSLKQLKSSVSEKYLSQYNEYIKSQFDEIAKNQMIGVPYNKSELLNFFAHVRTKYEELLEDKNYVKNQLLVKDEKFVLNKRTYDNKLAGLRYFNIQAILLYKELLYKLKEIVTNRQIVSHHKEILLDNFIGDVISYYIASCEFVKKEYPDMLDEFFIGIQDNPKSKSDVLYFFNSNFFELYEFIMKNENLRKYYK